MIGYINYAGFGDDKESGGIEIYYRHLFYKSESSLFFTHSTKLTSDKVCIVNQFSKKGLFTSIYKKIIRPRINDVFMRNHIDWYFQLYYTLRNISIKFDYFEVPDSFGYGIVLYLLGIPYVVKTHTPHSIVVKLNRWKVTALTKVISHIEKIAIKKSMEIISPSQAMIDYLIHDGWSIDLAKTSVYRNKINISQVISNNEFKKTDTILFVGNLEPRKNLMLLLEAYYKYPEIGKYKLNICGKDNFILIDGLYVSYWDYCCSKYPDLKNSNKVKYSGFINNRELQDIYSTSAILVVPSSEFENYPTVILEAIAHEVIVFGSDIGGISEMITDNVNGFLFESDNPESLFSCFQRLGSVPLSTITLQAKRMLYENNYLEVEK